LEFGAAEPVFAGGAVAAVPPKNVGLIAGCATCGVAKLSAARGEAGVPPGEEEPVGACGWLPVVDAVAVADWFDPLFTDTVMVEPPGPWPVEGFEFAGGVYATALPSVTPFTNWSNGRITAGNLPSPFFM
jgi:hypothetical protein